MGPKPEILAPCGDMPSFLAAMAAGADAVYLGLKAFSARMEASNFSSTDLSRMTELAERNGRRIYLAFNTLIKPGDTLAAARLIARVCRAAPPHGLIVQDPGMFSIARAAGYEGKLILSTLANVTHADALATAKACGAGRVVLPRELSVDEIRSLDAACPEGLEFEIFIHGALCWCVSGRCYWSSYMGGKSGLRGRCVQPCRRMYQQQRRGMRAFSCLDLSLDVLAKTTLDMPHVASWKIEGRKKEPHYVYHVTTAYKILRDEGSDPRARKEALAILDMALGRRTTRAHFLPQRDGAPTKADAETGSGLLVGKIRNDDGIPSFKPHMPLIAGDYLRIGTEDEAWHSTIPVTRRVPKAGTFTLRIPKHKTPKAGTAVYLIDRREPELMRLIDEWRHGLDECRPVEQANVAVPLTPPDACRAARRPDMHLSSQLPHGSGTKRGRGSIALWLTPKTVREISRTVTRNVSWWMPPVIWPTEEESYRRAVLEALRNGAAVFVLNAPWQVAMFPAVHGAKTTDLVAGPFCNLTNAFAIDLMRRLGFSAAVVSPELASGDLLALPRQSPLPLGIVLDGFWPMGLGRQEPEGLRHNEPFRSPKGETFWTRRYGQNTWVYPAWPLDLSAKRASLEAAGYAFFIHINEQPPKSLPATTRPGLFNWDGALL